MVVRTDAVFKAITKQTLASLETDLILVFEKRDYFIAIRGELDTGVTTRVKVKLVLRQHAMHPCETNNIYSLSLALFEVLRAPVQFLQQPIMLLTRNMLLDPIVLQSNPFVRGNLNKYQSNN
jgi:hypothetical protein